MLINEVKINDGFVDELKKYGFFDSVLFMLKAKAMVNIDVEDLKRFENDDIVGFVDTSTDDINEAVKINYLSDQKPNKCLLFVSGKVCMKLTEVDEIIVKIKATNPDINILFGANADTEQQNKFVVKALLTFNDGTKRRLEYKDEINHTKHGEIKDETDLMYEVARFIAKNRASINLVQNEFSLGFNRTVRIMDKFEDLGIISHRVGSNLREVLIKDEAELKRLIYGA